MISLQGGSGLFYAGKFIPGDLIKRCSHLNSLELGLFMALMDISIISTCLYTISIEFNDYRKTIWAALAYTLADIAFSVFVSRLSDVLGRKAVILISFFIFTCFSLASGLAHTAVQLIIFRTIQGVGGTGLYALTILLSRELPPAKVRPLVVSMTSMCVACAGVCGPVIGGLIVGNTTWRCKSFRLHRLQHLPRRRGHYSLIDANSC